MGCFKRTTPKPQNSEHDCKCAHNQTTVNGNNQHVDCKVKKRFHLIFPEFEKMGGFDEIRPKLSPLLVSVLLFVCCVVQIINKVVGFVEEFFFPFFCQAGQFTFNELHQP